MESIGGLGKSGAQQKREYDRVSFLRKITIKIIGSNRLVQANSIDINIKGLRFFSEKIFSANERVAIQVWHDNVSPRDPLWLNASVVWSTIEQDGAITGVQFDDTITQDKHPKLYQIIYANGS